MAKRHFMNGDSIKSFSNPYLIRDARAEDIDDVVALSELLNTVNLPSNRQELESVIQLSEASFSLNEKDATKRAFLFVLVAPSGKVIGTSQIFAKHGTLAFPHLYFQVDYNERYSETLKKYFRHRTLRFCQSFDGPTEICSLVLNRDFRSSKEKLGKSLSYVRFLFMAMKPDFFSHRIIAELLPPLGANLESALGDAVGRKFTGLEYYEADIISRNNKEFIKTLFPSGEIYVSLLPMPAQEVIGQVGPNSKGAAHLLAKIGFTYSHRVDPFDGGPHFEAEQENISLLREAVHLPIQGLTLAYPSKENFGLLGRYLPQKPSGERFRSVASQFFLHKENMFLLAPDATIEALGVKENDLISAIFFH
jgi:arginine N-succinyltransferase